MSTTEYTDPATLLNTRELDYRKADGIEVRLLWNSRSERITVAVYDEKNDEHFILNVTAGQAYDAFNHPFAYTRTSAV